MSGVNTGTCPECGNAITPEAPKGLCAACLVRLAADGIILEPPASSGMVSSEQDRSPRSTQNQFPMLFGGYELLAELGRGGMGVVYQARQLSLNRMVALKMLLHGRFSASAFIERFHLEAEAAAHLDHPNIVPIYEVGQHEGQPYYSMKLIEGRSLEQELATGPMQPRQAAQLVLIVARAVAFAHARGVLHRDIKPHNILLDCDHQPHLADFGLAKLLDQESQVTVTHAVMGSPSFMAPEQAAGKTREVTTAADVYGLGAVLYAMLTGNAVFHADTPVETLRQVIEQQPVRPRALNLAVDRDLETICLKCLQKEAAKRYTSARALAEDLENWLHAEPIQARRPTQTERLWLWCRRRPVRAALTAALLLVFALGSAGVTWQWRRATAGELLASQNAYAADMNLAQAALEANKVERAVSLLDKYRPRGKSDTDLRGWEWRYLWQLCRPDHSTRLEQPSVPIGASANSQDGKVMAVQTGGDKIVLWDLTTKRRITELPGSASVEFLVLSPTGNRLAVSTRNARGDPTVEVWDANGPALKTTLPQTNAPRCLALSPDGALVATLDDNGTVALVDWETNHTLTNFSVRPLRHLSGAVAFSPDGSRLAVGEDYGRISLLNLQTGGLITMTNLTPGGDAITALAFSPSGEFLAAGCGNISGTILLWDPDSGAPLAQPIKLTARPRALAFTPNGRLLASAENDQMIRVWRVTDLTEVCHFRGHQGEGYELAFLPHGQTLVSSCDENTACFWELASTNPFPAHVKLPISFGPGLQGTLGREGFARSNLNAKVVRRFGFTFTGDGRSLITTDLEGVLGVWDIRTIQKAEMLSVLGSNYWGVALSPYQRWLAAGDALSQINVWDWEKRRCVARFALPVEWQGRVGFSPSSRFLWAWTAFNDWTTRFGIWRVEDWKEITPPGIPVPRAVDISPDDRLLAAGDSDGFVSLCDFPSGQRRTTLTNGCGAWPGIAFSPDGRTLAVGTWDGIVRLWDASARREVAVLRGHSGIVWAAGFSPNGRRLATGGSTSEEAVKVWDLATRRELLSLEAEGELFAHVAFSPDGDILMATSIVGVAHRWRAPSWAEIEAAEKREKPVR